MQSRLPRAPQQPWHPPGGGGGGGGGGATGGGGFTTGGGGGFEPTGGGNRSPWGLKGPVDTTSLTTAFFSRRFPGRGTWLITCPFLRLECSWTTLTRSPRAFRSRIARAWP